MTRTPIPEEARRARAEAQAAKERESAEAWSDYANEVRAVEERTARLRAQRLAKEAADAEAAAATPSTKPAARKRRKSATPGPA